MRFFFGEVNFFFIIFLRGFMIFEKFKKEYLGEISYN